MGALLSFRRSNDTNAEPVANAAEVLVEGTPPDLQLSSPTHDHAVRRQLLLGTARGVEQSWIAADATLLRMVEFANVEILAMQRQKELFIREQDECDLRRRACLSKVATLEKELSLCRRGFRDSLDIESVRTQYTDASQALKETCAELSAAKSRLVDLDCELQFKIADVRDWMELRAAASQMKPVQVDLYVE